MHFIALGFHNFRNLERAQEIDCDAKKVFLIGNNGTGKTNFLDVVYTLSYGSSFKALDKDNAFHGTSFWKLSGIKVNDKVHDTITVSWTSDTGKQYYLNKKHIQDRKYLISINPAILFSYEDLSFVKGSHESRRVFIDQTASLCSDNYIELLRNYKKILKLRNVALKSQNLMLLEIYTEQIAQYAFDLVQKRKMVIAELSGIFADTVYTINNGLCKLTLRYKPSLDEPSVQDVFDQINRLKDRELVVGMTIKGPHRDRIEFNDEIGDFSERASMGQLRSIALSLRIAQSLIFSKFRGTNPVHLYDDVLLELDYGKRIQFMQHLPPSAQSFFTFLPTEPYRDYSDNTTKLIEVTDGKFIHRNCI